METEFIKIMHSNYARIRLEENPDERKYQYGILSRGGIRGLLPCSIRRIDNECYLYYDITSLQSISQMFRRKKIERRWIKDFLWSLKEIRMELDRFLLSDEHILWFPEQIYQDLENHIFLFMYMPYYEGENGFLNLLNFILENLNYDDEKLVEFAYKMYSRYEENGDVYLQGHIFEDAKVLDEVIPASVDTIKEGENFFSDDDSELPYSVLSAPDNGESRSEKSKPEKGKRKVFSFFEKKTRGKEEKERYRQMLQLQMDGQAVAEETVYGENYGRTFFMDSADEREPARKLYTADEKILAVLEENCITIGKHDEEADIVIKDPSVSRIHARITKENGNFFIEDMNSTNGTQKNGLRLEPYEKKSLKEGDEIVLGKVALIFR